MWFTDKKGYASTNNHRKEMAYISGGMSGVANFEEAFNDAAATLRDEGLAVCNPAETSVVLGKLTHEQFLRFDIARVLEADVVFVLDDWQESVGATGEVHMAQLIGTPVIQYSSRTLVPRIEFRDWEFTE